MRSDTFRTQRSDISFCLTNSPEYIHAKMQYNPDTVGIRKQENTVRLLRFVPVLHDERYVAFLQHLALFVVAGLFQLLAEWLVGTIALGKATQSSK